MKNIENCIVIPTKRACSTILNSYVKEIDYIQNKTGEECPFILMDECDFATQKKHKEILYDICKKEKKYIYHVNAEQQKHLVDKILDTYGNADKSRMKKNLLPSDISYGAAANKTFLLAAILQKRIVHRRDSDTNIQMNNGNAIFPSKIELKFLGYKVSDFESSIFTNSEFVKNELDNNSTIYMVGGNYLGEWAGDYREIFDYNPELLYRHVWMNMPNKTYEQVKERVRYRYLERNNEIYDRDKVQLVKDGLIEVGNFALYDIFLQIPLMPCTIALSMDYFYHSLLETLSLPKVYHNRHVMHFHSSERKSMEWFLRYHLGIAKSKVLRRYLENVYSSIDRNKNFYYENNQFNNIRIADAIMNAAHTEMPDIDNLWKDLSDLYSELDIEKYKILSEFLCQKKEKVLREVVEDMEDFAYLTYHWKDLCKCAADLKKDLKLCCDC